MATRQVKCDDCEKKNCPQRLVGSVCSVNGEMALLVEGAGSRDPILVSRFIISVVGNEYERYLKAKDLEDIGGEIKKTITHKDGKEYDVYETKTLDNNVSTLAMNIIKSGKIINEILNPPKAVPFNQTNIQNNFGVAAADEIRNLTGLERKKALAFIDEKLDAKRPS